MSLRRLMPALSAVFLAAGCVGATPPSAPTATIGTPGATSSTAPATTAPATAVAGSLDVVAVSMSSPAADASAGLDACNVRGWANQVAGMGVVAHARLLPEFIALTGREPEINSDAPVFVVQYTGTVKLGTRGGRGSASYLDVQNLTCAFLDGWPHYYLTGPWVDSLGRTGTPEPATLMDKELPAPLP